MNPFGTGLSQHARLITLASSRDGTLPEALAAERFLGREGVNALFAFDVDALSVSTDLDLDAFLGGELTVTLLQPDGTRRNWHGLCTQVHWLGADGGLARYRLRLEPALALLRLRRDSWIFQDQDVRAIVTELLADYPQVRFAFDVTQALAPRPIRTQYRESDLDFLLRVLASEGWSFRFEHGQDQPGHTLVIFDSQARVPDLDGGVELRYHGVRATDTDDAIDRFAARRQAGAQAVSIASWDPAQLLAPASERQTGLDVGALPLMAVYDGSGERVASGAEHGGAPDLHSRLVLQALEADYKVFEGAGAVRRLAPGRAFRLAQHARYPAGEDGFTVLWVEHDARNNLRAQIRGVQDDGVEHGTYRNRFACVRDSVALVPAAVAAPAPVTAPGPQTALVVGLADAVATTNRDHQVRIQFPWQRGPGANPGGLPHDVDAQGSAPGDERSGTWVRVAEALAGPNWGSQFLPRIGSEVLVDFVEGDIDRPVVVAQLYNGAAMPPFAAGENAGANHAGTLSGIHSHTFDGAGYNQWQLDDTPGQLRLRLATSTAASQLNLGYLVQQTPGSAQRGRYRGSGFELRTDAWAIVRGAQGVLLTASTRADAHGMQMDAAESLRSLRDGVKLAQAVTEAAAHQRALTSADAQAAHHDLAALLDKPERFGAPLVVMDAPAIVNWATTASTVLFAGRQLRWTAQGDAHVAAGGAVGAVAARAVGLFSHAGGIQAVAANGPVSVQAHTDRLEILADGPVTVTSVSKDIVVEAQSRIVLQAGQASVILEGGDITFACPGEFTVKSGQHSFAGGASAAAGPAPLPDLLQDVPAAFASQAGPHSLRFAFAGADDMAVPAGLARQPFRITDSQGKVWAQGTVPDDGRLPRVDVPDADRLALRIGDEDWTRFANAPAAAPPAEPDTDPQVEAQVADEAQPYAPLDDDAVHLSKDVIAQLIGERQA